MDLSTIIGIVLGFALIVWGIKIPQLPNFWDPQSLALTLHNNLGFGNQINALYLIFVDYNTLIVQLCQYYHWVFLSPSVS